MKLTKIEIQVMSVLWKSKEAMTTTEIIDASKNKTWKENSIYIIVNTLAKKGAVAFDYCKPTTTNKARAFLPIITPEDYIILRVKSLIDAGVDIDIPKLIKRIKKLCKK